MPSGGHNKWIIDDKVLSDTRALSGLGLSQQDIADFFGISRDTIRRHMNNNPDFAKALKGGRQKAVAKIAKVLYTAAEGGNMQAIIFYMKTVAKWKEFEAGDNFEAPEDPDTLKDDPEEPKTT